MKFDVFYKHIFLLMNLTLHSVSLSLANLLRQACKSLTNFSVLLKRKNLLVLETVRLPPIMAPNIFIYDKSWLMCSNIFGCSLYSH